MKAYSGAAGTQECHRGPTAGPLALRNAVAGLQWGRWHTGMPSRAYSGAAGTQERHRGPTMGTQGCHSRDGMGPLAWPLMLNNKKLMPRYSRLLKKIRVFVAGL